LPAFPEAVREAVRALAAALVPHAAVVSVQPLRPDATGDDKALGYGEPLLVTLRDADGAERRLVFRTQAPNEYGHDRRADRFEAALLASDVFPTIPRHVAALDVGAIGPGGRLVSLRDTGEAYLVTTFAEGTLYAEDLRRLARAAAPAPLDLARCDALARYLARLHAERLVDPVAWRRAVRDLLGHGEGIFGVVDGYPRDVPGAPAARLRAIEERCLGWRWRLRGRPGRLARTHGDFHPFNLVFRPPGPGEDGTGFTVLDASRGGKGDPADDVVALAVNYPFFALDHPGAWRALGPLWHRFLAGYRAAGGDAGALEDAPPFLAWRALVLASPRFYPHLSAAARDALLALAERALEAGRLEPAWADALFPEARR
jgi:hypothetical protein